MVFSRDEATAKLDRFGSAIDDATCWLVVDSDNNVIIHEPRMRALIVSNPNPATCTMQEYLALTVSYLLKALDDGKLTRVKSD